MREMKDWREYLIERLAVDPEEAIGFLQAVLEDYPLYGNAAAVVSALGIVVESRGGTAEVAKRAGMDPQTLSKILSSEETLPLDTFATILKALGCRLSIEPIKDEEKSSYIELTGETEVPKFANAETQLAESDSTS